MSTPYNGDNFRRSLQRKGRMMMVVFLSPLHSPWSGYNFRTWLSKKVVTVKMKTVMGMIKMITWGDLVHSYVTYNCFVYIWCFKKEETISHYKALEKTVWECIDNKNHCPYICGHDRRIPTERRGDKIIRDIYITRKNQDDHQGN